MSFVSSSLLRKAVFRSPQLSKFAVRHSSTSSPSLVSWSVNEETKVGTITINTPESLNALTVEVGRDFRALINELEMEFVESSNVQAVVIQGAGDVAFSAGGNLEWLLSLNTRSVHANVDSMLTFYNSFLCMRQKIPVPIIAALHGPAMGAGCCLALACDLRVAAGGEEKPTRVLGFPFTKLGIPSGMAGLYQLQQSGVSTAKAAEILLNGETLTGDQADELGLISKLVPKAQVKEEAHAMAANIAKRHPVAVRSMIRNFRLEMDKGLQDALYKDAHAQAMCYNRQDWGRGLKAVAEKKDADFDEYHSH